MFVVYKITNSVNGKSYIGITSRTVEVRWCEHLERVRHGIRNSRIYAAIRKYGSEAFERETLAFTSTESEARSLETHYIHAFDTYENGYNSNLGGFGFLHFPDHIRRKISIAQRGKYIPPSSRLKMSQAKLGDGRCAANFGLHTRKGKENPRAGKYLIRFPDGTERTVCGLRAFCREHRLIASHIHVRGHTKGYVLLKRFND